MLLFHLELIFLEIGGNVIMLVIILAIEIQKVERCLRHYQVESALSLSGSNADERIQIKPSEQAVLII